MAMMTGHQADSKEIGIISVTIARDALRDWV
jgi:hypothetical protein